MCVSVCVCFECLCAECVCVCGCFVSACVCMDATDLVGHRCKRGVGHGDWGLRGRTREQEARSASGAAPLLLFSLPALSSPQHTHIHTRIHTHTHAHYLKTASDTRAARLAAWRRGVVSFEERKTTQAVRARRGGEEKSSRAESASENMCICVCAYVCVRVRRNEGDRQETEGAGDWECRLGLCERASERERERERGRGR